MKKTFLLIILCLSIGCDNTSEYSKKEALQQSFDCLKIKNEIGKTSNLRNPYLVKLSEILQNDDIPEIELLNTIDTLSQKMRDQMKKGKLLIENQKPKHKDSRFYKATIEYLNLNQRLEIKAQLLVQNLIDKNAKKTKIDNLKDDVIRLAQKVLSEQKKYKLKESEFHNENNIVQQEVDSIVNNIKGK